MKCPYCRKRVAKRPERCPHCDYELPASKRLKHADGGTSPHLRTTLIVCCVLAVAVGVTVRWLGSEDTIGKSKLRARSLVGTGIEALVAGEYEAAMAALDGALRENDLFAEAHLARSMTRLAIGDFAGAVSDANNAENLFDAGRVDARAWEGMSDEEAAAVGTLIAQRARCVAQTAAAMKPPPAGMDAGRVFRIFYEIRAASTCESAAAVLADWRREPVAYTTITRAMAHCQKLWRCEPSKTRDTPE